jgi:hypothetical protein
VVGGNSCAVETRVPKLIIGALVPGAAVLLANVWQHVYQIARAVGLDQQDGGADMQALEPLAGVKIRQ